MNITIITVGKLKEKYLKDAIDEYSKRLSRYCKLDIVEIADEKTPDLVYESIKARVVAKGAKVIDSFFVQTDMKNPLTLEQAKGPVAEWINKNNLV